MSKNVLVVDDEPVVQYSIKRILEEAGLNVTQAGGGRECLDLLRKGYKGLILMDIIMPEMDGWDTIQALVDEGLNEGNIICMLTGKEIPDAKMDKLKEYVLDYIRKPFDNQKLIRVVKDYLNFLD
ncbi:MAG TPA: response regulator [bacterium]